MLLSDLETFPPINTVVKGIQGKIGTVCKHNLASLCEDRYDSFDILWEDGTYDFGFFLMWMKRSKVEILSLGS